MKKILANAILFGLLLGAFHHFVKPVFKRGGKGAVKVVKFVV